MLNFFSFNHQKNSEMQDIVVFILLAEEMQRCFINLPGGH